MKLAARLLSLFVMLIAVGAVVAGLSFQQDLGAIAGALLLPVILGLAAIPALVSLGNNRPRIESFGIVVNKIYVFLIAAVFIGLWFKYLSFQPLIRYLPLAVLLACCFTCNAVALQRQRKVRATVA